MAELAADAARFDAPDVAADLLASAGPPGGASGLVVPPAVANALATVGRVRTSPLA